jgi:hypothetical protein
VYVGLTHGIEAGNDPNATDPLDWMSMMFERFKKVLLFLLLLLLGSITPHGSPAKMDPPGKLVTRGREGREGCSGYEEEARGRGRRDRRRRSGQDQEDSGG